MAQWRGQFSGLTHRTKLEDAEATLRVAVEALRRAPLTHREKKAKAVRHLVGRVLDLRLKRLRAMRNRFPVAGGDLEMSRLLESERLVEAAGLCGILSEFGASDAGD